MSSDEESLNNGDTIILDAEDEPNNIENVQENEENNEVQRDEEGDNEAGAEKTTVKPKRVARNPLPKLNHETLKGMLVHFQSVQDDKILCIEHKNLYLYY